MSRLTLEQHLRQSAVKKETLDRFLDSEALTWAQYDPVCGYRLKKYMPRAFGRASMIRRRKSRMIVTLK